MADVEELAEAFPEVDLETLGRAHEMLDRPTRENVAEVLEAAKQRGKVPDADYIGRVQGATEPKLHPDFARELEKEGLDPEKAEEGLRAEQQIERENWRQEAVHVVNNDGFADLVRFYVDLNDRMTKLLQSPTREDIPDDMGEASRLVSKEIEGRIDQAGMAGDDQTLVSYREELHQVPVEDLREALLDKVRDWLTLCDNSGSEITEAREWVTQPQDPGEVAERLQKLRRDQPYDVSAEQVGELTAELRRKFGLS